MKPSEKQIRALSLALVAAICLNLIPLQVFAAGKGIEPITEPTGICEHHPSHTEECGYAEAVPETPCAHIHTEDCWREEVHCVYEDTAQNDLGEKSTEDISSVAAHMCSETTQCVVKILDCQHQHDGECGYAPAVPGHPCEFVCPICSQAEDRQAAPYYLLLIHTLAYHDTQYGFSEVIRLTEEELQDGGCDLGQHVLEKDGMAVAGISCFNPETGDLEEVRTLSPDSFAQGGDLESGEGYLAAQVLIEYQVVDGYRPVLQGDSTQLEDPYGVMPLTSFEGGNIKDITFVPADVLTVRLEYKYSPTGGLAGMDAADSQVFQLKVDGVTRDDDGNITAAGPFTKTWDLPFHNGTSYPTLEGFRIVLNPKPLNDFVNDPVLAERAMNGELSAAEIQAALESDAFSVKTDNITDPERFVYQWQVNGDSPPATYDDYPTGSYGNRYSDKYNEAWDNARSISNTSYTAQAVSQNSPERQGANPLSQPQLTVSLTAEQCRAALNASEPLTVTVYYRRNAGFYHVGHWVPKTGLSTENVNKYTTQYSTYNQTSVGPFDQGYLMVYLEHKQGRVGALTNARAYPPDPEAESILGSFRPRAVNQKTIKADTRVDILYDIADRYGLIFQTEDSYIPRQYVNKGYTVTFTTGGNGSSAMQVKDKEGKDVSDGYAAYENPTRQGYTFAGWKYEVHSDVTGTDVTVENGKHYKTVKVNDPENNQTGTEWNITDNVLSEAVVIRDSDSGDAKMIYLYPVWTPDMANVRVVYWTEDLGGGANDVDVNVDETGGGANYRSRVAGYLDGHPADVGSHFSNVGSFTFMAPTNSELDLFMSGGQFATGVTDSFETTGESVDKTGTDNKTGTLKQLIDAMFPVKMPDVATSTDPVDTSKFYHPYSVQTPPSTPDPLFEPEHSSATYTVAADGSTVINVYYARNVYTLDFTYYGTIDGNSSAGRISGTDHDGVGGLVVATNTTAYSKMDNPESFDYNYQNPNDRGENRWQKTKDASPAWTVPQTITISAKYDADLREVWPLSQGETVELTLYNNDLTNGLSNIATFMSWGATAGPFNQSYRDPSNPNTESTIIGSYRSMSADIIADPENTVTVHHLVAYWWNKALSNYRRNACYEVPGLTAGALLEAVDAGEVTTYDLTNRPIVYDFDFPGHKVGANPLYGVITIDGIPQGSSQTNVSYEEKVRRDTLYLVRVDSALAEKYFKDYESNFIKVNENGEPAENGPYYAVRRVSLEEKSKVYALGRQAMSVSTNWIALQAPTAIPNMTPVPFTYICEGKLLGTGGPDNPLIMVDHDTRAWDNWGRTAEALNWPIDKFEPFVALGSAEHPYDIWFYYDRARFTIHYLVASRNSVSGEYEIGTHETIYGQNMTRYNLNLNLENGAAARIYSNDAKFKSYWTATKNTNPISSTPITNGLNAEGYTRLSPDSAEDGAGRWECKYWSLDRSGSGVMKDTDWNRMVTGNLRVFAQWTPPTYRVKFDFDGGSYNGSETFPIQTVKANVGYTSSGNSIPSPIRDGFVFNGWSWYEAQSTGTDDLTAGTQRLDFTFETPITRDMVLKANWDPSAKTSYNYKIWYLTDDENAGSVNLPNVEGEWLTGNRGTPEPDSGHAAYTHVLGCQYVGNKALPEGTILSLAAVAIPGYAPVNIGTTLALDKSKNGTGAEDTENVAYFYYRKSQVKSYMVRYQLWNKEGDEGIIPGFTTENIVADSTYFTPGRGTWQDLRDAGYYLVQINEDGTVKMDGGEPLAARTYQDLSEFVNSEIRRFDAQPKGENMTVTFKVAPYFYTIQYQVGTVKRGDTAVTPSDTLVRNMQTALDNLAGEAVQTAVAAGKNPTRYVVADFDGGSFTLKNPNAVQDLDDPSKEWRFTGWSPASGTNVISGSRSVAREYPTLEIERSEGDLKFLANWELADKGAPPVDPGKPPVDPEKPPVDPEKPPVDPEKPPVDPEKPPIDPENPPVDPEKPPVDPENPPVDPEKPPVDPEKPPVDPEKPPVDPERPGSQEDLPTVLPDPNSPDAPELIIILENGVPTTYRKVWDPEMETWIYIPEEDVPLHRVDVPDTGDHGVFPWGLLSILSFLGLVAMLFQDRRKKKDSL